MLKQSTLSESDAQLHACLLGLFNVRPKLSLFRIFSVILNDKLTNKSESSDEELNRVCLEIKTKLRPAGDQSLSENPSSVVGFVHNESEKVYMLNHAVSLFKRAEALTQARCDSYAPRSKL